MQIRIATPVDAPRMIPVINAAFACEAFMDGTRTDDERIAPYFEKGEFLIGEEEGRLVASVWTQAHGYGDDVQCGYFGMLGVDPALQGRGLATRMIKAAEDRLREQGCKRVEIWVLSLRPELFPVYRHLGYVETGTEEFKPSRPMKPGYECHCVVMSKGL